MVSCWDTGSRKQEYRAVRKHSGMGARLQAEETPQRWHPSEARSQPAWESSDSPVATGLETLFSDFIYLFIFSERWSYYVAQANLQLII